MSERQIDWARVNAGLAVHLFGWRSRTKPLLDGSKYHYFEVPDSRGEFITVAEPHDYTTWSGLGEVVDAMKARGYWWESRLSGGGYAANFIGNTRDTCYADTAPRAGALACLRALNVEVPYCE